MTAEKHFEGRDSERTSPFYLSIYVPITICLNTMFSEKTYNNLSLHKVRMKGFGEK